MPILPEYPAASVVVCNDDPRVDLLPCVLAAVRQEYGGPFEVLLIDDGTGNPGVGALKHLPVTVIRKKRARGWTDSMKRALGTARYDILACTDTDCTVPGDWLQRLVGALGGREVLTGNLQHGRLFSERFSHFFTHYHFSADAPGTAPMPSDGNFAIRRDLLRRCLSRLPASEGVGSGAASVLLGAAIRRMGVPIPLDPRVVVHHRSEDFLESLRLWFCTYGANTLDIRRLDGASKGARFLKLGFFSPVVFASGRCAADIGRFARSWKRFGMRPGELPLCVTWYGACAAAYLLGMLHHLRRLRSYGPAVSEHLPRLTGSGDRHAGCSKT